MKICIVVASPDIIGGHSVQAGRLVRGLSGESGIEVECVWINPRLPGVLRNLQRLKYVRTVATLAAYIPTLLIRLWSADLVHVFSASYWSFLLGAAPAVLIASLYRKPVLLNYHSGEAEDHLARWGRIAVPIIRLTQIIVVPSLFLVEVFARFNLEAIAIANTVDLYSFRFRRREPLGAVLLCNRNLEANYNVACAIRAFALIEQELPSARLIVAGDGIESAGLKRLAMRLGIKNADFIGAVSPEKMPSVFDSADVFVNSSVVDCMPLSILEAFACGLPVVTTRAGGIPYVVRHNDNGLLVELGNHVELARGILSVLQDRDLARRLVERARADCRQYTWESTRSQWLAVYQKVMDGQRLSIRNGGAIDGAILTRSQEAD